VGERTEGTAEIDEVPARVLAVIVDFESYPEWAQGVKATQVLQRDQRGRATEVAFHVSTSGIDARYTLGYRYLPRNGGLTWTTKQASGAVKDVEGEYFLERSGAGTRVTYRLSLEPAISLPGFLRRTAERTIVGTALGGLKDRVESTPTGRPPSG
jgi:ribosome-associated toxin RatA of RatAB toxin-antitoxin module